MEITFSGLTLAVASGRVMTLRPASDLLDPISGPVDVITANLPYQSAAVAAEPPDLAAEPLAAVFAPDDGLGAYRRLVEAAGQHLAPDGALVFQLYGEPFVATRAELPALRVLLGQRRTGIAAAPRDPQRFAGAAA